jgi:hypothetical protein
MIHFYNGKRDLYRDQHSCFQERVLHLRVDWKPKDPKTLIQYWLILDRV